MLFSELECACFFANCVCVRWAGRGYHIPPVMLGLRLRAGAGAAAGASDVVGHAQPGDGGGGASGGGEQGGSKQQPGRGEVAVTSA